MFGATTQTWILTLERHSHTRFEFKKLNLRNWARLELYFCESQKFSLKVNKISHSKTLPSFVFFHFGVSNVFAQKGYVYYWHCFIKVSGLDCDVDVIVQTMATMAETSVNVVGKIKLSWKAFFRRKNFPNPLM